MTVQEARQTDAVHAANELVQETAAKVAELESQLRSGEGDVSPADLVFAKAQRDHAVLALDGAIAKAEREEREERERAGRDLHDRWIEDAIAGLAEVDAREAVESRTCRRARTDTRPNPPAILDERPAIRSASSPALRRFSRQTVESGSCHPSRQG